MVTNEERARKYADAITVGYAPEHRQQMARWFGDEVAAVMAVADAELAQQSDLLGEAAERMKAAEAKVDRIVVAAWDHPHCIGECGCALNAIDAALDGDA